MRILLLMTFALLSVCLAFPSQAWQGMDNKKDKKTDKQAAPVKAEDKPSEKNKPQDNDMERFVMPFTKWVEGKLHSSPVVNPTKEQISKKKGTSQAPQVGLRGAIKQALAVYPGTVLSADKTNDGGTLRYRIKIISADGVVKIITVPTDIPNEK